MRSKSDVNRRISTTLFILLFLQWPNGWSKGKKVLLVGKLKEINGFCTIILSTDEKREAFSIKSIDIAFRFATSMQFYVQRSAILQLLWLLSVKEIFFYIIKKKCKNWTNPLYLAHPFLHWRETAERKWSNGKARQKNGVKMGERNENEWMFFKIWHNNHIGESFTNVSGA